MSDNVIGKVRSASGREFHVKWDEWGAVYVKEISGGFVAGWDGPSQKASSAAEAMRIAEAFVAGK